MKRYMCKACERTFNALTGTPLAHLQKREKWLEYARAIVDGLSLRKAAKRSASISKHRFVGVTGSWRPTKGAKASAVTGIVRRHARLLERLAANLDPNSSRGTRLRFNRKGAGRRSDATRQLLKNSAIAMELRFETMRARGKQEAAIFTLSHRVSRATMFRSKHGGRCRLKKSRNC